MEPYRVTEAIIRAAMEVHSALGPGLLETAYRACLLHELRKAGLNVQAETQLPINYDGVIIEVGYRVDLLVEDIVVVELKAVARPSSLHDAQILSYLKLSQRPIELLINFHVLRLKTGIKRFVNNARNLEDIKTSSANPRGLRG